MDSDSGRAMRQANLGSGLAGGVWIALLAAFLWLPGSPGVVRAGQTASQAQGELTVMSYNIMVGRFHQTTGQFPGFPENLEAILKVMRDSRADVILVQEVDVGAERSGRTDQARLLGEGLGFHYRFAPAIDFQGGKYGIALLSRWPILEHRVVPLFLPDYGKSHPEWGIAGEGLEEQRVALVARVDVPGRPLTVINTHLGLSQHQRRIQTAQLAALIEEQLQLPGRSVVLGGDLNCEPDARELAPLRSRLADAYHQIPNAAGMPRDIRIRDRLTVRSDQPSSCIDYIFYRGDSMEVLETRVLDSTASDHRPVLTRLRFR